MACFNEYTLKYRERNNKELCFSVKKENGIEYFSAYFIIMVHDTNGEYVPFLHKAAERQSGKILSYIKTYEAEKCHIIPTLCTSKVFQRLWRAISGREHINEVSNVFK